MPHQVIRAVQRLSSAHAQSKALWSGRTTMGELVDATVWSQQHFPKFLAVVMLTAGVAGNCFMGYLRKQDQNYRKQKIEEERLEICQKNWADSLFTATTTGVVVHNPTTRLD